MRLLDPIPGSPERIVEIHGTPEQLKAAQSLLQAFVVASGEQSVLQPRAPLAPSAMQAPVYPQY